MIDTDEKVIAETAELDRRITFHHDRQILEADISGFHFDSSEAVNRFYDRLEERIADSGEDLWFFLVNLNGTRIDPVAWTAYSRRGRALNHAHSMGSVRFDASEETRRQILRAADTEAFDPNLFSDRDAAIRRLAELPSQRRQKFELKPTYSASDFAPRISFDADRLIMNVDLSGFTLHHSRDVDDFYDFIEDRIRETDRKWFFLIDLNGCRIMPAAWVRHALRGKRLNRAASLGTARYAAGAETEEDIRMRAESQSFRPNIRNTRQEALDLIEDMRLQLAQG